MEATRAMEQILEVLAYAPTGLPSILLLDALGWRGVPERLALDVLWDLQAQGSIVSVAGRLALPMRPRSEDSASPA